MRSFQTAQSPILFLVGLAMGPKGFPGVGRFPFLNDEERFIGAVEETFSRFFPHLDIDSDTFDVDMYLFSYRWFVGNTDCTGLQEAADSVGCQVRFPYNSARAILRQVSTVPAEVIDKRVLKKHFGQLFPQLQEMIWYPKDNTVGATSSGPCLPGREWMRAVTSGLESLPRTAFINDDALGLFVSRTRDGSFTGSSNNTPTERQLHFASLMMCRNGQGALEQAD
jgi:hypothetical protein